LILDAILRPLFPFKANLFCVVVRKVRSEIYHHILVPDQGKPRIVKRNILSWQDANENGGSCLCILNKITFLNHKIRVPVSFLQVKRKPDLAGATGFELEWASDALTAGTSLIHYEIQIDEALAICGSGGEGVEEGAGL